MLSFIELIKEDFLLNKKIINVAYSHEVILKWLIMVISRCTKLLE